MKAMAVSALVLAMSVGAAPLRASDDKTHQQIMAEIRMLQEQQAQLAHTLAGLADTLKSVTAKIDDQSSASRKTTADQKLLIDGIAENVRILREKSDDTNVRLSSMTQELESMRQTIASMPPPTAAGGVTPTSDPVTGAPVAPTTPTGPPPSVSPDKAYQAAWGDYTGGQYDLAIAGFEFYLKQFPKGIRAPEAQLNIGNAHYAMAKFSEAVAAFQKVISDYSQSDSVPAAYYKLGLSYEGLKQIDLAKRAYETAVKNFPNAFDTQLARQRLEALNRKIPNA